MANKGMVELRVDISDMDRRLGEMKAALGPEKFQALMIRTFNEVGRRSKKIISDAVRQSYEAPATWIKSDIKRPQIQVGGARVGLVIPIQGERGIIGNAGKRFKATKRGPGANVTWPRKGQRYKILARVVKRTRSVLPPEMSHIGNQPPFIPHHGKLAGLAFSREGKKRLPIQKVVGIAVPQMPDNIARPQVEKAIYNLVERRLEHNFAYMTRNLK